MLNGGARWCPGLLDLPQRCSVVGRACCQALGRPASGKDFLCFLSPADVNSSQMQRLSVGKDGLMVDLVIFVPPVPQLAAARLIVLEEVSGDGSQGDGACPGPL
ncbi:hypothetical protein SKAU_G00128700 [Synaphobranchus kaupii]|uniref:Uncharacterized protein n=1 Tax=Synaphobranchus kaupii TaxID=118154 RepID=A0A9Q1J252_SYNKA|nr:hypothetical protein SKAU_G00128700 [Synaphobranchus kaupii]